MDRNDSAVRWRAQAGGWITRLPYLLWALPLVFFTLFFVYPLLTIFAISLRPEGVWNLTGFVDLVQTAYYRDTLLFTIGQAALSTVLTIGLALPGAYCFTRFRFPGRSTLLALAALPFVLPTVVVAAAFSALIGERGLVNTLLLRLFPLEEAPLQLERTLAIILIVHVFYNYALALRLITSYWANQSTRMEDAARVLGCAGWRLWWWVRLPLLRPAILAAAALVFIFTFTSFGVVLLLGGPRFATLEVQIYYQALNIFDLPLAAALALVQMVFMLLLMIVYTRLQRRISLDWASSATVTRPARGLAERTFLGINLAVLVGFLFAPLLALVLRSVSAGAGGLTWEYYRLLSENPRGSVLFVPPFVAVGNSLVFALLTTLAGLILGLPLAYLLNSNSRIARWLDPIFMLPLATSAVTLGFGYIVALDEPPLNLRASWVLIPIAHTLVAIPFVVRSTLPALRAITPNLRAAAAVLGAPPLARWRAIDWPLINRSLMVGAAFAFTVSMGEFGASLFIARPDTPTIPIVIFRLLGQPGSANYGQALAMSVILLGVCALSFILIERLRRYSSGEF